MAGFIFGGNTGINSAADLARQREIVNSLLARQQAPRNVGEGLSALGDGIVANVLGRRADKAEAAGTGAASGKMAEIMAALGGTFPEAPGAAAQAAPMDYASQRVASAHNLAQTAPNDYASQRVAQAHATTQQPGGDVFNAFMEPVKAKIQNPYALAAIASTGQAESGFDPGNVARTWSDPSQSGDPGTAGGIMSWRGDRLQALQQFGGGNMDPATQAQFFLQENPQLIQALSQAGSVEEAQQLMNNAWRFAGYDQQGGEAARRLQTAQGMLPQFQGGQPQQPAQMAQAGGIDPVLEALGARAIPKDGPSMEMLMGAAGDQWMNDSQKGIVEALLSKKLAGPKYDFMAGKDGSIFRANETDGSINQVYGGKPDTFRVLTPEEKAQFGLPPEGSFQIGADNKISKIGGEGTTVNIDSKTEGAFDKKLAEKDAEVYSGLSTDGMNAKADLGIIGELGSLLQGQGGTMTGVAGWLAQKGIGTEGMGDLQAAQALINKLVPTQRQPGSGSMSDRDVELFTRSLPSLWNVPGGNEKILGVMQGLAQYKAAQGQIADQVLSGQLDRQTARKMLSELPNPLAEFRGAGGDKPKAIKDMTDEELEAIANGQR